MRSDPTEVGGRGRRMFFIGVIMNFPPKDSPVWPIVRAFVVGLPLCLFLAFNYHNGWSTNDWTTVVGVLAPLGVFDFLARFITRGE